MKEFKQQIEQELVGNPKIIKYVYKRKAKDRLYSYIDVFP